MRTILLPLLGACGLAVQAQPPAIGQNGVFNSASRIPSGLTGASIARGSRFTIEGVRLSGSGIKALLEVSGKSIVLPVLADEPRRMEVWMPAAAPLGPGSLMVATSAGASKPFSIRVVAAEPGIYSVNGKGWGQAKIDEIEPGGKSKQHRVDSPAARGDLLEVPATGLGAASGVEVIVGGRRASEVLVRPASQRGFDSIRFRVPRAAPEGCFVPMYARIPGVPRSNVVTISIGNRPSGCKMPEGWPWPVSPGRRIGLLSISRATTYFAGQPPVTSDESSAAFYQAEASAEPNRLLLLPPAGTCTAYTAEYYVDGSEFESISTALASAGSADLLDAGAEFKISDSSGSREVPRLGRRAGSYWVRLGSEDPSNRRTLPLFLNSPRYTLSVAGGKGVPAFFATLTGLPSLQWTNREALATIERSKGVNISWVGALRDTLVVAVAASFDALSTAGEISYCLAKPEAGLIYMPPEMLAHFPPTGRQAGPLRSGVMLAALRLQEAAPVLGVDRLDLVSAFALAQKAIFQ